MKTRGVNIGGGGHIAKEIGDNILDAVVDEVVSSTSSAFDVSGGWCYHITMSAALDLSHLPPLAANDNSLTFNSAITSAWLPRCSTAIDPQNRLQSLFEQRRLLDKRQ